MKDTDMDPYLTALADFEELLDNAAGNQAGPEAPRHWDYELRDQLNILRDQHAAAALTEHEPLPHWAARRATGGYADLMASLPTKDGRRTGNAVTVWRGIRHSVVVAQVVTDAGNIMFLTGNELVDMFHPPEYVMASLLPAHREALDGWLKENEK